jgi:hypothetical protein
MTGIFVILGLVILIVIYVFFEAMASLGAAGYSPAKLISELLKKKSDKIDTSLTKTPVPLSDEATTDDSSKRKGEPDANLSATLDSRPRGNDKKGREIARWKTAASSLMAVMMVYLLTFFYPSIGNAFSPFDPWIGYAFWPLLLATIIVFIILRKKERQSKQ